jgi:hypothetical protein
MSKPTRAIMRSLNAHKQRYSGILQPDYSRLEEAHLIKRNPETDEISWASSNLEDQLRKAGLI